MTSRPIALVTGATSGIGAEFARQLADRGHDLVLVARDAERLARSATDLADRYGIHTDVLVADLLTEAGLAAVEARLASAENPIDVLVNNAGFGLRKPFHANAAHDEQRMHDILATVPLRLTHAALRQQLPRRRGRIINVASVAAYGPRGVYGASKRWLVEFSRWANVYYRRSGVTVTAVNPGFVHTELHERMGVSTRGIPGFMWVPVERVVRTGLRRAMRGRAVSTPTLRYRAIVALMRMLPPRLAAAGRLRER